MTEKFRVWHASRDPYHCVYRMVRLLTAKTEPLAIEKLRLLDMFLLFPALLHRLWLPAAVKSRFRELKIEHPSKQFVRLPGTASVWQDLQIYQSTALKQMFGKGMLEEEAMHHRRASLVREHVPAELLERAVNQNRTEQALIELLVKDMADLPATGSSGLIRRAGLPARGPVL